MQRLAEPAPSYEFERYFQGQPVAVRTRAGSTIPGVIAAPSVHFKSDRPASSVSSELFVDIGASSREDVDGAGVAILDRVRLDEAPSSFAPDRLAGPWASSRAGAAMLLALAEQLVRGPPPHEVTLAFVTQQYFHNTGLLRILRRTSPERVVLIRPGGPEIVSLAPVEGWTSDLRDELLAWAEESNLAVERGGDPRLSFGPFNTQDFWPDKAKSAVLTLGPDNSGTPVEIVDRGELEAAAKLLAHVAGVEPFPVPAFEGEAPASDDQWDKPWLRRLSSLVRAAGVSGHEEARPRPHPLAASRQASAAHIGR